MIVDKDECIYKSWQYLYFDRQAVKYIRIIGTKNTKNTVTNLIKNNILYNLLW